MLSPFSIISVNFCTHQACHTFWTVYPHSDMSPWRVYEHKHVSFVCSDEMDDLAWLIALLHSIETFFNVGIITSQERSFLFISRVVYNWTYMCVAVQSECLFKGEKTSWKSDYERLIIWRTPGPSLGSYSLKNMRYKEEEVERIFTPYFPSKLCTMLLSIFKLLMNVSLFSANAYIVCLHYATVTKMLRIIMAWD